MNQHPVRIAFAVALAAAALTASPLAVADQPARADAHCPVPKFGPGKDYQPVIHPRDFGPHVTNPWFPLSVGTTYIYTGHEGRKRAIDVVQVSHRTRRLDGVRARVVNDRLFLNGHLEERTSDYYAQDRCGNVWYFGEDTATLDRSGHVVDRSGSFHAGVDGAQPGVFMQRHPQIGRRFRQEWYRGQAEDRYRALTRNAHFSSRFITTRHALLTQEKDSLEPRVVDHKYYVRGIGDVDERTVRGGSEHMKLVAVLR